MIWARPWRIVNLLRLMVTWTILGILGGFLKLRERFYFFTNYGWIFERLFFFQFPNIGGFFWREYTGNPHRCTLGIDESRTITVGDEMNELNYYPSPKSVHLYLDFCSIQPLQLLLRHRLQALVLGNQLIQPCIAIQRHENAYNHN